jgi:hypothetical protein
MTPQQQEALAIGLIPCPFCPFLLPEDEGHYYGDCAMYLEAMPDEIPGLLVLVGQVSA